MSTRSVLIVDDEPDIVAELVEALEFEGFQCLTASRVDAAIEVLDSGATIDVLLSDIRMPGRSGLDLISVAESHSTFRGQIVVMSGHGASDDEVSRKLRQGYPFLKKPISLDHLVDTLNAITG
jgi:DNA-binding NtrC family response regulator